jgi:hypothetical protein
VKFFKIKTDAKPTRKILPILHAQAVLINISFGLPDPQFRIMKHIYGFEILVAGNKIRILNPDSDAAVEI